MLNKMIRLIDYGFRSAFLSDQEKIKLRREALSKCIKILKENEIDITPIKVNSKYYHQYGFEFNDESI